MLAAGSSRPHIAASSSAIYIYIGELCETGSILLEEVFKGSLQIVTKQPKQKQAPKQMATPVLEGTLSRLQATNQAGLKTSKT